VRAFFGAVSAERACRNRRRARKLATAQVSEARLNLPGDATASATSCPLDLSFLHGYVRVLSRVVETARPTYFVDLAATALVRRTPG
jgi:hypothetical protein